MKFYAVLISSLVGLSASPAFAQSLSIDFNGQAGPTQSGFVGVNPSAAAVVGGVSVATGVTLELLPGTSIDGRNRTTALPGNPVESLVQDFAFSTASEIDVRLSGVASGTYDFLGYFHDTTVTQIDADISYSVDGGTTFVAAGTVNYTTGVVTIPATLSFRVIVPASAQLLVRVSNPFPGPGAPTFRPVINGFVLTEVPRPVTATKPAALAALACLAMAFSLVLVARRARRV